MSGGVIGQRLVEYRDQSRNLHSKERFVANDPPAVGFLNYLWSRSTYFEIVCLSQGKRCVGLFGTGRHESDTAIWSRAIWSRAVCSCLTVTRRGLWKAATTSMLILERCW